MDLSLSLKPQLTILSLSLSLSLSLYLSLSPLSSLTLLSYFIDDVVPWFLLYVQEYYDKPETKALTAMTS